MMTEMTQSDTIPPRQPLAYGDFSEAWKTVIGAAAALAHLHIEDEAERESMMAQVRLIASAIPSRSQPDLYSAAAQGQRLLMHESALKFMLDYQKGSPAALAEIQLAFEQQSEVTEAAEFSQRYCERKMQAALEFKQAIPQRPTCVIQWSPSSGHWMLDMVSDPPLKAGERLPLYSSPTLLVLDERTKFEAWFIANKFGGIRESMWAAWEARALLLIPMMGEADELEKFNAWFVANKFGGMRESMKAAWLGRAALAEADIEKVFKPEHVLELLEGTLLSAGGAEALRSGESVEFNLEELVLATNLAAQVARKMG